MVCFGPILAQGTSGAPSLRQLMTAGDEETLRSSSGSGGKPQPAPNRNNSDCVCTVQEMEDSRAYTGRNPIPLPWTWQAGGPTDHDIPYGNWYSSPRESECDIGTPFGTKPPGCTWQQR